MAYFAEFHNELGKHFLGPRVSRKIGPKIFIEKKLKAQISYGKSSSFRKKNSGSKS